MYNFVTNKEANEQINRVYDLLKQGKSDSEITDTFNTENISNLQSPSEKWSISQISHIRETFKLDSETMNILTEDTFISKDKHNKASKILIFLSVIIVLFLAFMNFSKALFQHLETGRLIGQTIAPLILPLIVVGLFQLGKRFRNKASRVKIFFWTVLVTLVVKVVGIGASLQPPSQEKYILELGASIDTSRVSSLEKAITKVKEETKKEVDALEPLNAVILKAESGDADAQEDLGKRYLNGMGVEINKQTAYDWYYKAAEQGNSRAQYRVQ